ncbi:lysozyme [Frateuria defendens]|uniref:lysozyme n=1 Tax=Frateuria defendens TaxID=2219559 RepID=UPI0009E376BD|nr:lysozyme [Frateuria defendens]
MLKLARTIAVSLAVSTGLLGAGLTHAEQGQPQQPGLDLHALDRLNPDIPLDLAARIAVLDHPMGSQIRLHEGNRYQPQVNTMLFAAATGSVAGMDVSGWQGNVNWSGAWSNGARFAYVKATEGTGYTNPYFAQQYNGSYNVGMIRGSYHFARPDVSSGHTQADYFVNHGGGWSGDGKTLPGALDMEYNPYGATCYGLSQSGMAAWISDFSNEYHLRTGRWPVIYTSNSWWTQCVGTYGNFSNSSPLWVARYSTSPGTLPYAWAYYTLWQYADSGTFPGDQDTFNGAYDRLQALSNG